eukprot:9528056-Ditylum_brightwellii.AAC.1
MKIKEEVITLDDDSSEGLGVFIPRPKEVKREELKVKKEEEVLKVKKEDTNEGKGWKGTNCSAWYEDVHERKTGREREKSISYAITEFYTTERG